MYLCVRTVFLNYYELPVYCTPVSYTHLDVYKRQTMYPVLRRLQKDECLEVYDMQFDGRNRRYYKVTEKGMAQLNLYKVEWKNYTRKITEMFEGGAAE